MRKYMYLQGKEKEEASRKERRTPSHIIKINKRDE